MRPTTTQADARPGRPNEAAAGRGPVSLQEALRNHIPPEKMMRIGLLAALALALGLVSLITLALPKRAPQHEGHKGHSSHGLRSQPHNSSASGKQAVENLSDSSAEQVVAGLADDGNITSTSPSTTLASTVTTSTKTTAPPSTTTKPTTSTTLTQPSTSSRPRVRRDGLPTLFCFSLMWTSGVEPQLMKAQVKRGLSIFSCDYYAVYNGGKKTFNLGKLPNGESIVTTAIHDLPVTHKKGTYGKNGATTNSWLNTPTWIRLWKQVRSDGIFRNTVWTAKIDPDAVFLVDRLRHHLVPHFVNRPLYIRNGYCWGEAFHFQGAAEVISQPALEAYFAGQVGCQEDLPWQGWSEDYYMEHCLDSLGVAYEDDHFMVSDEACLHAAVDCTEGLWAIYHPHKTVEDYLGCLEKASSTPA